MMLQFTKLKDRFNDWLEKQRYRYIGGDEVYYIQHRGWGKYVVWLRGEDRMYEVSFVHNKAIAKDVAKMLADLDLEDRKRVIEKCYRPT